tara:strand:- start:779 stop:976 length:198 start_codon:yes stop_codon:yes gene_type:complete
MNRYLESGNLIVRTDSFDMEELSGELSEPLMKKKDIPKVSTWKKVIIGNDNNDKNLTINNFPQLK